MISSGLQDNEVIYFTPEEVAALFRVEATTVRQWLRDGSIRGIKVGNQWRIHRDEISRLQKEQAPH